MSESQIFVAVVTVVFFCLVAAIVVVITNDKIRWFLHDKFKGPEWEIKEKIAEAVYIDMVENSQDWETNNGWGLINRRTGIELVNLGRKEGNDYFLEGPGFNYAYPDFMLRPMLEILKQKEKAKFINDSEEALKKITKQQE